MGETVRILGIAGSLRRGSYNRAALRVARELVPEGATMEIFDIDGIRFSTRTTRGPRTPGSSSSGAAYARRTPSFSSRRSTTTRSLEC